MHLSANTSRESLNASLILPLISFFFRQPPGNQTKRIAQYQRRAQSDSKPTRPYVPWAGEILFTPEPQDDVEIQKEVDEDDEEFEAPTVEELDAYNYRL